MADWIREKHEAAAQRITDALLLPHAEDNQSMHDGCFDPWELFPSLYGSYSNDFDEMAIEVLEELASEVWGERNDSLASNMFREMLCTSDLCEYGTSPRACFPTQEFKAVLSELITKWKAYSEIQWAR